MGSASCTACGADNRDGARFCGECGTALALSCPQCGSVSDGSRFCTECGAAMPGAAAAAGAGVSAAPPGGAAEPVAERRIVSLLFADLVGFTTLSESRDPEAVRELLSTYFERARDVVERYGGTIEKFIGDAVFAVWGVPTAREDDAERAVRAGLDLISAVSALGQELQLEGLAMRVGVTTGQVAVTLGAVGEGMVAGDAVNTAARVQTAASPGEVWVDDTTRSLTTAGLAYESTGFHDLKGKAVPLELFRTVRTTATVGGDQRVDGLEAPFVGRDRELRLVKELFHATAEERRARLVLVAGEPGIGKSRLAWEFEKYVDAITSNVTYWMRGRCLSYGQGIAGRVVAEMIRSLLRVTDTDAPDIVRAALDERLAQHVQDPAERDVLWPRLASLLGLEDGSFEQADLFACWRGFLEALTSDGASVTLVAEDLQWADDGFLDFLDHLLEAAHAPIMIVALARPEVTERRPGVGAGRRATTVFLEPLSNDAMSRLLDGLVGDLPPALRDELVRRADGVPLYAVETVRSLIDRDVVVPVGGRYVVNEAAAVGLDLGELAPPASLHALLSARLDALSAGERRVVQDASVLGLTFTRSALEMLTPSDIDLDAALDGLRRKEIVTVDTDPRSPERGQLRFVQALLRGVAYDTLSRRDRKARHIATAEHLATVLDVDAIAAVLAAHYLDAAAAVPEDSDADLLRANAAELLERAAVHAVDVGAPRDALGHYQQLIELGVPGTVTAPLLASAAELAYRVGAQLDLALEWVQSGLADAIASGKEDDTLVLRLQRAMLHIAAGTHLDEAQADAHAVFDASVGVPRRVDLVARAARAVCQIAQAKADVDAARDVAVRALADVESYGDDEDFGNFLDTMSMWFGIAGYRRLATLVRRAASESFSARHARAVASFANLAAVQLHDAPLEAHTAATQSMSIAATLGMNDLTGMSHRVAAAYALGRWEEAVELLDRHRREEITELTDWETYLAADSALFAWSRNDASLLLPEVSTAESVSDPVVRGWWHMRRAVGLALDGDDAGGLTEVVRAIEAMHELGPAHEDMPFAYTLAAEMLIEAGDWARLEQVTSPLRQLSRGQRYRVLHGLLTRSDALLGDDPITGLREAVDVLEAAEAAYWVARTRVDLAVALADAAQHAAAAATAAAAEPLLREIGAGRAVARLERIKGTATAPA